MWTRGPDKENPGCFYFELWDANALVERRGGFKTHTAADRAAEAAQRRHLFSSAQIDDDIARMSVAELGRELGFGTA